MFALLLPPSIRSTIKCERCGQLYPKKQAECSHCSNLSDREVEELKETADEEREGNANLGRLFFYLAIIILLGILAKLLG